MEIRAVATPDLKIEAAIASLPPNVRRLMASADVVLAGKTISVADLDRKLAGSGDRMPTIDKLTFKLGLNCACLLI